MSKQLIKKKESKWNSKGGGMSKHRKSGVAHNHAVSIARVREENKRFEQESKLREERRKK